MKTKGSFSEMFYLEKESNRSKGGREGGTQLESLVLWLVVLVVVVVVVVLLLMMSATWRPLHLWVLVSYRLVYIIDQDILQIIKHCSSWERESYF